MHQVHFYSLNIETLVSVCVALVYVVLVFTTESQNLTVFFT